jgi:S-adenosylmethionine:tRNA ribosyltransferase-isomerase
MDAGDFSFDLPPELVAQDPPPRRGESRLLVVRRGGGIEGLHAFAALPELLKNGDLLVYNDSRVLPARLWTRLSL